MRYKLSNISNFNIERINTFQIKNCHYTDKMRIKSISPAKKKKKSLEFIAAGIFDSSNEIVFYQEISLMIYFKYILD